MLQPVKKRPLEGPPVAVVLVDGSQTDDRQLVSVTLMPLPAIWGWDG
jgi:hypothetical protein